MLIRGRVIDAHRRPPSRRRFHSMSEHYPVSLEPSSIQPRPHSVLLPIRAEMRLGGVVRGTELVEVDVGEECVGNEEEGEEGEEEGGGSGNYGNTGGGVSSVELEEREIVFPLSSSPSSSLDSSSTHGDTPTLGRRRGSLESLLTVQRSSPQKQAVSQNNTPQQPLAVSKRKGVDVVRSASPPEIDEDMVYIDLAPIFATHYVHVPQGGAPLLATSSRSVYRTLQCPRRTIMHVQSNIEWFCLYDIIKILL